MSERFACSGRTARRGLAEAYTNTIEDDAGTVIYRITALVDVTARERVAVRNSRGRSAKGTSS